LIDVDRYAPNRLLFNAHAFQSCGALIVNPEKRFLIRAATEQFVALAMSFYSKDGYFIEGEGYDTSYQGVAIRVGEDLLLAGYEDSDGSLRSALSNCAKWLSARVDSKGRINSSGNTRTCWSKEVVFGSPKLISIPEVFTGLAYSGIRTGDSAIVNSARRVENWASTNAGKNPCFRQ